MKRSSLVVLASSLLVACLASSAPAMYHPTLGRFLSRDPIRYGDGMDLYEYTRSMPISAQDPLGEQYDSVSSTGGAIVAEIGMAEAGIRVAQATGNFAALSQWLTRLQSAMAQLETFVTVVGGQISSQVGSQDPAITSTMLCEAERALRDAQRVLTHYREATKVAEHKLQQMGMDPKDPKNLLERLRRTIQNVQSRIRGAERQIEEHLKKIEKNPDDSCCKVWQKHIEKHEQNIRAAKEAIEMLEKEIQELEPRAPE